MKRKARLVTIITSSVFLFSCAQTLSRVEATELLDKIVLEVRSKNYEMPTSYSVSYHEFMNDSLTDYTFSVSYADTKKSHYCHHKATYKYYDEDPKTNPKASYSVLTEDKYYYIDPLAKNPTYISYSSLSEESFSPEGSSSDKEEAVITFSQVEGEEALLAFENQMNDEKFEGDCFSKDIINKAVELDKYLKTLSGNQELLVKESEYRSVGDGNLYMYLVTVKEDNEESRTFQFDDYLIRQYELITKEGSVSVSYNWGSYKSVYPDLTKVVSSESLSSI